MIEIVTNDASLGTKLQMYSGAVIASAAHEEAMSLSRPTVDPDNVRFVAPLASETVPWSLTKSHSPNTENSSQSAPSHVEVLFGDDMLFDDMLFEDMLFDDMLLVALLVV